MEQLFHKGQGLLIMISFLPLLSLLKDFIVSNVLKTVEADEAWSLADLEAEGKELAHVVTKELDGDGDV